MNPRKPRKRSRVERHKYDAAMREVDALKSEQKAMKAMTDALRVAHGAATEARANLERSLRYYQGRNGDLEEECAKLREVNINHHAAHAEMKKENDALISDIADLRGWVLKYRNDIGDVKLLIREVEHLHEAGWREENAKRAASYIYDRLQNMAERI